MARVTDRGSDGRRPRGRGPDPVLRAVAVVGLVVVAALLLRARQGLDWGHMTDPLQVQWTRVVLGSVVVLVLLAVGRRLLQRLRRAASRAALDDDEHAEPEGEPMSLLLKVAGGLLVAATMWAVLFVIRSVGTLPGQPPHKPPALVEGGNRRQGTGQVLGSGTTWGVLATVAVVLVLVAVVSRYLEGRRAAALPEDAAAAEEQEEVRRLVAAVDAADAGLRSHADPREAVLAAYRAMAGQLSSGLVRHGRAARGSDTATELLDHAVEAGLVSGSPARRLTELFREARYSRHPMGEPARQAAEGCLAQVRAELAARRG